VAFDDNGIKAFAAPFYKPDKGGNDTVLVRSINVKATKNTGVKIRGGLAALGEMISVKIYKSAKSYLVAPQYQASQNLVLDAIDLTDFSFCFNLSKNDLVEIKLKNELPVLGYFVMFESDGRITLREHSQSFVDKKYFRRGVSTASSIRKFSVDVLGNYYPTTQQAQRGGLA
jgi:CRISPR-associated endonuclease Csn1